MRAWLYSYSLKLRACLSAPILYHADQDGYVMSMYFTVTEIVDVYGTYILIILFIGWMVLERNYLLGVFTSSKVTLEKVKLYQNKVKTLNTINSAYNTLSFKFSNVYKLFLNRFKK